MKDFRSYIIENTNSDNYVKEIKNNLSRCDVVLKKLYISKEENGKYSLFCTFECTTSYFFVGTLYNGTPVESIETETVSEISKIKKPEIKLFIRGSNKDVPISFDAIDVECRNMKKAMEILNNIEIDRLEIIED